MHALMYGESYVSNEARILQSGCHDIYCIPKIDMVSVLTSGGPFY